MKNLLLVLSFLLSVPFCAQNDEAANKNPYLYEDVQQVSTGSEEGKAPAPPGTGVPIDDYVPALLIVGLGAIVLYRKKIAAYA